ncbi:GNAT family N-acetyltransferase [Egicoccus sp. AB-alg2]|uniref:GNAT family N-acetyltransferase n=1 Tax=Egicoccus sp. AB-alg2 TaxID=3242693 RepID=UPI00359F0D5F
MDLDDWQPLSPTQAAAVFAGASFPWWIAGGWALDLVVGRRTRRHDDLDVGVLRRDQAAVQRYLRGWELWAADPPGTLRPWAPGEWLPVGVHDVWARRPGSASWRFQLHVNEADGPSWVSRRDPAVRRSLTEAVVDVGGIPVLAPELQLLMKARTPRPKDEADFAAVLPALDVRRRGWLARHLPAGHPWLGPLGRPTDSGTPAPATRPQVRRLRHDAPEVAARLVDLQRLAYAQEAALVGSSAIPPLHETVAELIAADLVVLGIEDATGPVAALGYRVRDTVLDIDRLAVRPDRARQGLGRRLVGFVLAVVPHRRAEVATGAANLPARRLYESLGFVVTGETEPVPGLRVVHYRRDARVGDGPGRPPVTGPSRR